MSRQVANQEQNQQQIELLNFNKALSEGTDKKILHLSDSAANRYIPFHAGFEGTIITKGRKKILLYNEVLKGAGYAQTSDKAGIMPAFLDNMRMTRFYGRTASSPTYFVRKGMVYHHILSSDEYYPIILLGIDGKYIFSLSRNEIDYTQFCLFIDYRINHKSHAGLRAIFTDYFKECMIKGVNLTYTTDIRDKVYRNSFEYPKFDTVDEMKQYLKSLNELIYEQ